MPEDQQQIPNSNSDKQPRKKRPRTSKNIKNVDGVNYEKVTKRLGEKRQ